MISDFINYQSITGTSTRYWDRGSNIFQYNVTALSGPFVGCVAEVDLINIGTLPISSFTFNMSNSGTGSNWGVTAYLFIDMYDTVGTQVYSANFNSAGTRTINNFLVGYEIRLQLQLATSASTGTYQLDSFSPLPNCLCKGTMIKVYSNNDISREIIERPIENIMVGDIVLSALNNPREVLLVNRNYYDGLSVRHLPVILKKGSICNGDGSSLCLPSRDLICSGLHSVLCNEDEARRLGIEGSYHKSSLVDGYNLYVVKKIEGSERITFKEISERVGEGDENGIYYYHLVVEGNEGFYMNGLPSESTIKDKILGKSFVKIT